jgi:endonuclease/exonuclease/phosphatase family metal-dependent hydrolase
MVAFKVMTWNVENLFRPADPSEQVAYNQKLQGLSEIILTLAPDVLALQEIGSPEALADLVDLLAGLYPHSALSKFPDKNKNRPIRVGFLSKLPISQPTDIADFPEAGLPSVPGIDKEGKPAVVTTLSRGALQIRVTPKPGVDIHLLNTHLKSKLLSFPAPEGKSRFVPKDEDERARVAGFALLKRTAEAIALRVQANQLLAGNPKQALILLGDLNDGPDAATTQILYGPGGSQPGTAGFKRKDKGDDTRLFNLAELITPEQRRYSRVYQGKGELIDHILASKELIPGEPPQNPQVDAYHPETEGLPSITDDPGDRAGQNVSFPSDHAPITASFEL